MPRILRAEPRAPSKTVGSRTAQLLTALLDNLDNLHAPRRREHHRVAAGVGAEYDPTCQNVKPVRLIDYALGLGVGAVVRLGYPLDLYQIAAGGSGSPSWFS